MNLNEIENPSNPENAQVLGYVFSFTSAFFAGCATVAGKWNLTHISAILMNSMIFSIATVIMSLGYLPFQKIKGLFRMSRMGVFWLAMFSLSSVVAIWLFWVGVKRIDPSLAAFLNRSEVLIAVLMGIIFLKERFNRLESMGAVLSILGIVLMRVTLRVEYTSGFWYVLAGSFFFGLTEFFSKMCVKHIRPIIAVYIRNLFMALVYWIIFLNFSGDYSGLDFVWPGVLALGLFGPILSRMVYMMALKRLELSKVAVISQTQPIYVVILSLLILGQLPSFLEIAGGIFLTAGCLIMVLGRTRKHRHKVGLRGA